MTIQTQQLDHFNQLIVKISEANEKATGEFKEAFDKIDPTEPIENKSINLLEHAIELYSNTESSKSRELLMQHVIQPLLERAKDKIDTAQSPNKLPLLHQIVSNALSKDFQIKAAQELFDAFFKVNADFHILTKEENTLAHIVAQKWQSPNSLRYGIQILKSLYQYGCAFHKTNKHNETVLDCASPSVQEVIRTELGGVKAAELSLDSQKLREIANRDKLIDITSTHEHITNAIVNTLSDRGAPIKAKFKDYTYQKINTVDEKTGDTFAHCIARVEDDSLTYTDPIGTGKYAGRVEHLTTEEIKFDHREIMALSCAHGLKLTTVNKADETALSILKAKNRLAYYLDDAKEPRIRAAFQSQLPYKEIREIFAAIDREKQQVAATKPAPAADVKASVSPAPLGPFSTDAQIKAMLPNDTKNLVSIIKTACQANMNTTFNQKVGSLSAEKWTTLLQQASNTPKIVANLTNFTKLYYTSLPQPAQMEFIARLPDPVKSKVI